MSDAWVGTINIKMFDGLRELTGYIPALKNLNSHGALVTKSLKIVMADTSLKVGKGLMVVMIGDKERNLYYLKGSTVTGGLTASIDGDSTRLWHMRLGHTGKRALQAFG